MTTAGFVSWPLAPASTAVDVRGVLREELADADGPGVTDLLPDVGVSTVSVLLYSLGDENSESREDDERPCLVWYVEHEVGEAWATPGRVIREHSPLWPALEPLLADGAPTVVAETAAGATEVVHAFLPDRPTSWVDEGDDLPVLLPPGEDGASEPDVVPLQLVIRPGLGSVLARGIAGLMDRTPEWLTAKFEAWTQPILEAEGMYTETLLLERTDSGYELWWYMEAGDMGQVKEGFEESDSYVARLSEPIFGLFLENPGRAFDHPVAASNFELLAHAVAGYRG